MIKADVANVENIIFRMVEKDTGSLLEGKAEFKNEWGLVSQLLEMRAIGFPLDTQSIKLPIALKMIGLKRQDFLSLKFG